MNINYQKKLDELTGKIKEELDRGGVRPKLLLHSCCGPCSSHCLSCLLPYFDITVLYYNPNIFPEEEFAHRLNEQRRLIDIMNRETICPLSDGNEALGRPELSGTGSDTPYQPNITGKEADTSKSSRANINGKTDFQGDRSIKLIAPAYNHDEFLGYVKGLEKEPEGGARCEKCFELRLKFTAKVAQREGFPYFGTTLSVSPHKNALILNETGERIAKELSEKSGAPVSALPADFKKKNGYLHSIELSKKYGLYRQSFCGCEFSKI